MNARLIRFGEIEIDGHRFECDVVIEQGEVRRRRKKPSKSYRDQLGHTPLSIYEEIPWHGERLIIGTGIDGQLPIMPDVFVEAAHRGIEVLAIPTHDACELLGEVDPQDINAILHITC